MATGILSENPSSINHSLDHHDTFLSCLFKMQALINVALNDHFFESPRETMHDYLWVVSDLLVEARALGEGVVAESLVLQKTLGRAVKMVNNV